jgi:UDP-4-amino-4,6-dideoxy-N-acetyl-beta-L-altrosamine N-acetyltransferase
VKTPFLIGELIYLRPIERADAPLLREWINHPEVARTLRHHRPMNLQIEEEFIDRTAHSDTDLALLIAVKETDKPVGTTGLHHIDAKNRHAEFGILIGEPAEWGKGYGSEATRLMVNYAFETLNLNRIWLHVYEYNERGLGSYEKPGFKKEGVLRQENFREGRYWDTLVMGILREEWPSAKQ